MTAYFALLFARTPVHRAKSHRTQPSNITPSYVQLVAHQTVGVLVAYVNIDAGKLRWYHGTAVCGAVFGPFADNGVGRHLKHVLALFKSGDFGRFGQVRTRSGTCGEIVPLFAE